MKTQELDPKGLIRESYRIEGITKPECRSIFLDWALSIPLGEPAEPRIEALLAQYAADNSDHPMNEVLLEGLSKPSKTGRRGGRKARVDPH